MLYNPLQWPENQPRTQRRKHPSYRMKAGKCLMHLESLLHKMHVKNAVMTLNVEFNRRSKPRINNFDDIWPTSRDCGVALYYSRKGQDCVFACDTWNTVSANLRAIHATVDALYRMEAAGAHQVLDQMYQGFAMLGASPCRKQPWNAVLGVSVDANVEEIKAAYRLKAKAHHPDMGGTNEGMAAITEAYREALSLRKAA